MNEWTWNGARWWKFDFHAHTPASSDYGKGSQQQELRQQSPKDWLLAYMRAEVDCVAVTDHNSGEWIDRLKAAIEELKADPPSDYRELFLFPGMEISVHGGIHLLAIFDPSKTSSDIDALRGAVGYQGTSGQSDGVTLKSFVEAVGEITSAGGISIPAHVDGENGLFQLPGTTLQQAVDCNGIFAMELNNLNAQKPQTYKDVLNGNRYVRIQVVPYGARETVESEFRQLLQRGDGGFEKDIGSPNGEGLLGQLYGNNTDARDIEQNLANIKDTIKKINLKQVDTGALADKRFATHVGKLPPETIDRLCLWFPEDSLEVQYSATDDEQDFRPIEAGSPGQKTAALLAFLLSYGEEPLILDQPEDDLDNHLIYDLIVTQLREVKRRRQVIVVTHNANIVVNGDAELVVALAARGGETQQECEGSLQEQPVRDTICEVMEGGREAFEDRYRRIALGARHV